MWSVNNLVIQNNSLRFIKNIKVKDRLCYLEIYLKITPIFRLKLKCQVLLNFLVNQNKLQFKKDNNKSF